MITTVTTSTVAALSSIGSGVAGAIGIAAVVMLVVLLMAKELAGAGNSKTSMRISKFTQVPIVPLMLVFGVIIGIKVFEILS